METQKGNYTYLTNLRSNDRLVDTFADLITFDTRAEPKSDNSPSSIGQLRLGANILKRINNMGFKGVQNQHGAIIVHVPPTDGCFNVPRLCLLSHLDTACDASGANVNARLVKNLTHDAIELDNGLIIDESICPELCEHKGDDIIITDGTTLLGADDKAGVAVMLHLLETLAYENIEHGPLCFAFTVDEEIGRSCNSISLTELDSDFAVTIDGCNIGELDVATFNAKEAVFDIKGLSIHTAVAYKKLVNAAKIATQIVSELPDNECPEQTYGLDGFYHVHEISGSVQSATVRLIVRDFDKDGIERRAKFLRSLESKFNEMYGSGCVSLSIYDQYENMANVLKENPKILELCREAFAMCDVVVKENYVRGGTDGSHLCAMGLPCPNIFTGALNCHGPYECLPVKSLHKSYEVTLQLVKLVALEK